MLGRLTLPLAALSSLALAACQAPLPGQTNQNTQNGALIGAGLGAVAGALSGRGDDDEQVRNAVIGGALGAGVGASIGNNLDRQAAELRQSLGSNVGVVNTGSNIVVSLPQDILFATDSTAVSASAQGNLQSVAVSLNNYPNSTVNVIGNTDNVGNAAYNQDLSERRALAVASILRGSGVASGRINAVGRGEDNPIASNQTAEGRAQNRRVEIVITPNG